MSNPTRPKITPTEAAKSILLRTSLLKELAGGIPFCSTTECNAEISRREANSTGNHYLQQEYRHYGA